MKRKHMDQYQWIRLKNSKRNNNKYKPKMGLIERAGIECKLLWNNSMYFSGNQFLVKM